MKDYTYYAYSKAAIALIDILGLNPSIEGNNRIAKNLQTELLFNVILLKVLT